MSGQKRHPIRPSKTSRQSTVRQVGAGGTIVVSAMPRKPRLRIRIRQDIYTGHR